MDRKAVKEGLIYLYCITDKTPNLKEIENLWVWQSEAQPLPSGLADNLYFIYYQGLYAVVNKVKEFEFSEENLKSNLADFEWVKARVIIHEKVIEVIMKDTGVIPFKFATLFNDEDNLKAMFSRHLIEFKNILRKLKDKEEWGIKIYCNLGKLKENLMQELNIAKEINGSTSLTTGGSMAPGKAYLLKKKKEELLNIAVNERFSEYSRVSFDRLKEKSTEARINKLLSKEATGRDDEMILNSAFLINKDKAGDFLDTAEGLKQKYTDKGLFLNCTGPWPPYNFCVLLKEEA